MLKNLLIFSIILFGQNRFGGAVDYDALYDEVFGKSAIDKEWDVVDEVYIVHNCTRMFENNPNLFRTANIVRNACRTTCAKKTETCPMTVHF